MRFLKFFLLFIAILTLVFLAIGLLKPTINYGHEISVNASLQEAWDFHKDETHYHKWLEGFKSIEHLSGDMESVGSTYKVIVNPGEGQEDFEMIETIKDIKQYEYVDLHFDSDFMTFDQKTSFREADGKTYIKTDSKASGKGIGMRSMFGVMDLLTGSFQKQEEKNLEALKKLLDK